LAQLDTWYEHHLLCDPPNCPNLNAISHINMFEGLTCGDEGYIASIVMPVADYFMQITSPTNKNLYAIQFIDSSYIEKSYIVGESGIILKSNNIWFPIEPFYLQNSPTNRNLYSVYFIAYTNGVAVGDTGTVIRTTDGGDHWTLISSITQNRLYSVHFPSLNTGYAVGNDGIVIKTTDNGQNWEIKTQPVADSLRSVWFTNDNIGFVVSRNGAIYKTTNGGNNWQIKPSGITQNLYAIRFSSLSTGYAEGINNKVIKTTDAGETWTIQNIPTLFHQGNFKGMSINTAGEVIIVGSNGTILGNYPEPGLVQDNLNNDNLELIPNPAKDKITINLPGFINFSDLHIDIYNTYGQILLHQNLKQNNTELNISQLPQGIYFLKINFGDKSAVRKFIKY
jgi:photosystem II stability/assembly factor-like uncharacterized protein